MHSAFHIQTFKDEPSSVLNTSKSLYNHYVVDAGWMTGYSTVFYFVLSKPWGWVFSFWVRILISNWLKEDQVSESYGTVRYAFSNKRWIRIWVVPRQAFHIDDVSVVDAGWMTEDSILFCTVLYKPVKLWFSCWVRILIRNWLAKRRSLG